MFQVYLKILRGKRNDRKSKNSTTKIRCDGDKRSNQFLSRRHENGINIFCARSIKSEALCQCNFDANIYLAWHQDSCLLSDAVNAIHHHRRFFFLVWMSGFGHVGFSRQCLHALNRYWKSRHDIFRRIARNKIDKLMQFEVFLSVACAKFVNNSEVARNHFPPHGSYRRRHTAQLLRCSASLASQIRVIVPLRQNISSTQFKDDSFLPEDFFR